MRIAGPPAYILCGNTEKSLRSYGLKAPDPNVVSGDYEADEYLPLK
jgi:hypothetical protein